MGSKYKAPRYKMTSGHGDLPKGKLVYLSLYHRPTLDGHRMVTVNHCGQGAAYSVPDGLLSESPYTEMDED